MIDFRIYPVTAVNAGARTVTLNVAGTGQTVRYPGSAGTPSVGHRAWCLITATAIRPVAFDAP